MEEKAALRRKLLRGSLAAPVVLTVSSASAATASFARCLANTPHRGHGGEFFATERDNWFRSQVKVTRLWAHGQGYGHGQDMGDFYSDPGKGGNFVSVQAPYTMLSFGPNTMPDSVRVSSQSTRWALVWFDRSTTTQYSKITLQKPYGSTATTMSCYGSFNKA